MGELTSFARSFRRHVVRASASSTRARAGLALAACMVFSSVASARVCLARAQPIAAQAASNAAPTGASSPQRSFEEEFAYGDRKAALARLAPGSADHFYYTCLERQHAGDLGAVDGVLRDWIASLGRDSRVEEIEHRQALLGFDAHPEATWQHVRDALALRFDDQPDVPGARPELPTRLDPALLTDAAWRERAFAAHPRSFVGFGDAALITYAAGSVPDELLTALLTRLRTPDVPNLAGLVVRQLRLPSTGSFGSLQIHARLTLAQLEECARLEPKLQARSEWVDAVLARLAPSADEDVRRGSAARLAHLERLARFADSLPATFDSLRAHVRYHRLVHDLDTGAPDLERFLAYARMPRPSSDVHPALVERANYVVDLRGEFPTGFAAIRDDRELVRAYLAHFLRDANDTSAFAQLFESRYLERVFAETKLQAGVGDAQRWYALLGDPGAYEALERRVDLEFARTNREHFAADEPVALDVDVKNAPTLLVKVFEIHALNCYLEQQREIDLALPLDGLVANEERTLTFSESPIVRVRRHIELPRLAGPGTYVVELVGNGKASRALVRKGALRALERVGAAGHVFRVHDETGELRRDAALHIDGRRYAADANGEIAVPFSSDPGTRKVVVEAGARVALTSFVQQAERYELSCGLWTEREALIAGARAPLAVRALLALHGRPASLSLLEDVVLELTSTDVDGVETRVELRDPKLVGDAEFVHEIAVPERLQRVRAKLRARVKSLATNEPIDLEAQSQPLELASIDATTDIECALLGTSAVGWFLDVRGRNGEPRGARVVQLVLAHRSYADELRLSLQTDAAGRIELGALADVARVSASGLPGGTATWMLEDSPRAWPERVHGTTREPLRIAYPIDAPRASRADVALLERRGAANLRDAFEHVRVVDGYLELADLAPGEYQLELRRFARSIAIDVSAAVPRDGWAFGAARALELSRATPLQIVALREVGDALEIRLGGAGADTRVHVHATRYAPAFDAARALSGLERAEPRELADAEPPSEYQSGRDIGDEYRYVLERRLARKFPGNLLARPGLLLQPWEIDVSSSTGHFGQGSSAFAARRAGGAAKGRSALGTSRKSEAATARAAATPNLDFLTAPAAPLLNLRADAAGVVRVPLARLGDGQYVHVIALDARDHACASLARAERPLAPRDLRLAASFDAAKHLSERHGIDFVPAGTPLVIDETATSALESYDSLDDVLRYFRAYGDDDELARFEFLTRWPSLSDAQKRERYSEFACHELNVFLQHKDRAFFDAVVRPYLANKHERTFVDEWLLDAPLERYLDPWAFARLNVVEQILLARRVGDAAVARRVSERVELLPSDPTDAERRFATALAGRALASDTSSTSFRAPGPGGANAAAPSVSGGAGTGGPSTPGSPSPAGPQTGGVPTGNAGGGLYTTAEVVVPSASKDAAAEDDGAAALDRDAELRARVERLFVPLGATKVLAETDYWRVRRADADAELVLPNAFWLDFARTPADAPFVSANFVQATRNTTEMLLALALLDLPFEAAEPRVELAPGLRTLHASGPLLAVRKDVREREAIAPVDALLVNQDYVRLDDRYEQVGTERRAKLVRGEFQTGVAYASRVVLQNPTSATRELELLVQIPAGALPLGKARRASGLHVRVGPYATELLERAFYFPRAGRFAHYPAHVSERERIAAFAAARTLDVVDTPSALDAGSWEHVSQRGSLADVLAYLEHANLDGVELARLAWRMRDRAAYDALLALLRTRHAFVPSLWAYAVFHRDAAGAREYLRWRPELLAACGPWLESPLVRIDPVELHAYEHLDIDPLVYPRAHRFGDGHGLVDENANAQRERLLAILAHRPVLDARDRLAVAYQLVLEDRIEEALASFAAIDVARLSSRLQYDYLAAYLAFYAADPTPARAIAERYREYPVERWRTRFANVVAQLDEAAGATSAVADPTDRGQRHDALASAEPALELEIEGGDVKLAWRNLERCEIAYYPMDLELSFSAKPFVDRDARAFAFIRPRRTDALELGARQAERSFALPADLGAANVLVEVRAGSLVRRRPCVQGVLRVQWLESYGQLAVTHAPTGKPLPKTYVKVYARRAGGGVQFHKDGYTDLRGRFDYATVSGGAAADIERFAILVASETDGATIGEVAPPAR